MSSLSSPIQSASPATHSPPPAAFDQNIGQTEHMNSQPHQPYNVGGEAAPEVTVEAVHDDDSAYFNSFPPGFRFCPRNDELIDHYLLKKVLNKELPRNRIKDVELYKHDPEHLAQKYPPNGEKEWYFFTPRDRKYKNGTRPNRAAGNGYWKATGADKNIRSNGKHVGYRKALVFYYGKAPKGEKTNWIMHEFRVLDGIKSRFRRGPNDMQLDEWVLCKIYKKPVRASKEVHDPEGPEEDDVDMQIENDDPLDGYEDLVPADTPNNFNLSEMVCSYSDDQMDDYMSLMMNPPSVDEFNQSLQYNLTSSNPPSVDEFNHSLQYNLSSSNPPSVDEFNHSLQYNLTSSNPPSVDEFNHSLQYNLTSSNPPSVDEFNHSLQYNLTPLHTEPYHPLPTEPYHHLFPDHNVSYPQSTSLDDLSMIEPISFAPPPYITESNYEPRYLATGPANEDFWASKTENFDYLPPLDLHYLNYPNAYDFVQLEDLFPDTTGMKGPFPGDQSK